MARFDQVELEPAVFGGEDIPNAGAADGLSGSHASRPRRLAAFLTDLSLFVALALALSPLVPQRADLATAWQDDWIALLSLGGFIVLISYYYFAGTWLLWGKTVGGAIFDVKVVPDDGRAMDIGRASRRWAALCLLPLTGGIASLPALFPSRRSLADRLSATQCISG
jgi:uncharacterized RDD family membrane protein YckC